jgi:biopolymer transport protein ExbB/TolQ
VQEYQKRILMIVFMVCLGIITLFILNEFIEDTFLKARIIGFNIETELFIYSIQSMMWIVFFIAMGELLIRIMEIRTYEKQFYKEYLPEDIYTIIELSELPKISAAIKQDAKVTGSLASFIQKLLMQFQTSKSMEQTLNMLNAQLEIRSNLIDLNYNIIRYLSWLIPTLGFIGTVVGIANALAYAGKVNGQGATFVAELTQKLALAFDTTLVALVMSAVVVFLTHIIQGKEENNLTQVGQYCLDNLINKLYIN